MERPSKINPQKIIFDVDDVSDDVTQSRPSIFMFKWNCHIFRDTGHSFLTNHHQTLSTYVIYHNTESCSFCRSKVK